MHLSDLHNKPVMKKKPSIIPLQFNLSAPIPTSTPVWLLNMAPSLPVWCFFGGMLFVYLIIKDASATGRSDSPSFPPGLFPSSTRPSLTLPPSSESWPRPTSLGGGGAGWFLSIGPGHLWLWPTRSRRWPPPCSGPWATCQRRTRSSGGTIGFGRASASWFNARRSAVVWGLIRRHQHSSLIEIVI